MRIYAILDVKLQEYGPLVTCKSEELLKRDVRTMCKSLTEGPMFDSPSDFVLYELGSFNEENGVVAGCPPKVIGQISEFMPLNGRNDASR